jgi:NADP-dependent 3-hydroxy acid dehydrogenase YdfG
MNRSEDDAVLVTGSTRGIGEAIAEEIRDDSLPDYRTR